jgi:glycosyltransferase involved in cell wall biosynthesis
MSRDSPEPLVSVIIPVRNAGSDVAGVLACLDRQTLPRHRFEIVFGDDGSTDQALDGVETSDGSVRVVSGAPRNAYAARNDAVRSSRGHVLAFCDADCRPEPEWLEAGVNALARGDIVAGRIRFTPPRQTTVWTLLDVDGSKNHEEQVRLHNAETANLFLSRELFDRLGGFDERQPGYGDFELVSRYVDAGARLLYAPDVVVSHPTRNQARPYLRNMWSMHSSYAAFEARAGRLPDGLKLRSWVPVVQTFRARRRLGRSLGPDRRWLGANDISPTRRQRVIAAPLIYLLVPYLGCTAQLRGWWLGTRERRRGAA